MAGLEIFEIAQKPSLDAFKTYNKTLGINESTYVNLNMLVTIPLGSASAANVPGESPYVYSAGAAAAAAAASGAAPPPPPGGYETPPSALTSYMTGQTGALPSPYGSALYPVDNRYVGQH